MKEMLVINIVLRLNSQARDKTETGPLTINPFEYRTDGVHQGVWMFGAPLWRSDCDERDYINEEISQEREPLETYLVREANAVFSATRRIGKIKSSELPRRD